MVNIIVSSALEDNDVPSAYDAGLIRKSLRRIMKDIIRMINRSSLLLLMTTTMANGNAADVDLDAMLDGTCNIMKSELIKNEEWI